MNSGETIKVAMVEDDPRLRRTLVEVLASARDCQCVGAFPHGGAAIATLAAGAHGYLVKPVMPAKLLEAIREIRAGGVPMSRTVARQVIEYFHRPGPVAMPNAAVEDAGLGPREQQVLEYMVAGLSYKEVAAELGIKTPTVGTYVRRIYEKLHLRGRRELIARCKEQGGRPGAGTV